MSTMRRQPQIAFTDGWKYRLEADYFCLVGITPATAVGNAYLRLLPSGHLRIAQGYCWDGPSGPTVDTLTFMRGSLVHDALYQLIREGLLPSSARAHADRLLRVMCREDGMSAIRAWWVYHGVAWFGGPCASTGHIKPVRYAPGVTTLERN